MTAHKQEEFINEAANRSNTELMGMNLATPVVVYGNVTTSTVSPHDACGSAWAATHMDSDFDFKRAQVQPAAHDPTTVTIISDVRIVGGQ